MQAYIFQFIFLQLTNYTWHRILKTKKQWCKQTNLICSPLVQHSHKHITQNFHFVTTDQQPGHFTELKMLKTIIKNHPKTYHKKFGIITTLAKEQNTVWENFLKKIILLTCLTAAYSIYLGIIKSRSRKTNNYNNELLFKHEDDTSDCI